MPSSLSVQLINQTNHSSVWAYITGLSLQKNSARVFVLPTSQLYYPPSPSKILQPLPVDPSIPLGPPGAITTITIPPIAGGRIWFSSHRPLTFFLNPNGPGGGAALVEPSVLNPSDVNSGVDFAFCEFTLNAAQLFANITYVDFVPRLPVALTLRTGRGEVQHVSGMGVDGLDRVCEGLREQSRRDGRPWEKLVVRDRDPGQGGRELRALSPTHGAAVGARFDGYFEPLVDKVWEKYREREREEVQLQQQQPQSQHHHHQRKGLFGFLHHMTGGGGSASGSGGGGGGGGGNGYETTMLKINTQAGPGIVAGCVGKTGDDLVFGGEKFCRPTTADILGCNSGPFTTGPSPTRNAIIPRLAAAFQRGCILDVAEHPSPPHTFYRRDPTNHYARIVHECNLDGKGYAFAYDDVQPDGGADQSGKVNAGDPTVFIVSVGGGRAYVGDTMPY